MNLPITIAAAGFATGLLTSRAEDNVSAVHVLADTAAETVSGALPTLLQTPQGFALPRLWEPQLGGNFKYDVEPIPGSVRPVREQDPAATPTLATTDGCGNQEGGTLLLLGLLAAGLVSLDVFRQIQRSNQEVANLNANAQRQLRRAPLEALICKMDFASIGCAPKTKHELMLFKNELIKIIVDLKANGDDVAVRRAEKFLDSLDALNDKIRIRSAENSYVTIFSLYQTCQAEFKEGIYVSRSYDQMILFIEACLDVDFQLSHMSGELSERHQKMLKDLPRMRQRVERHNDLVQEKLTKHN